MKKSVFISSLVATLIISVHTHAIGSSQVADRVYTVKEFTDNIEFAKEVE